MSITNSQAAPYGLLLMYAMDMYTANPGVLIPPPDPRILADGWTIAAYLNGQDAILRTGAAMDMGEQAYYGFLARNEAGQFVMAVRGTAGAAEWVEDAEFVSIPCPAYPGTHVEQGFWGIYDSMTLRTPDNTPLGKAADAISTLVGGGSVMVIGHSLGSALATYLSLDLAAPARLGDRASACLFASPQTGDQAFTGLYDKTVADYRVFNYVLDLVPRVPLGFGYATLPRTTVLQPATAEASIQVNIFCNHHVICYVAMIDYELSDGAGVIVTPDDKTCRSCVLGPETAGPTMAKELGALAGAL